MWLQKCFLFIPLLIVLMHQGCTRINFVQSATDLDSQKLLATDSGNGGTYDGKLRILHQVSDESPVSFQCEGRNQPASILISKNAKDWVVIRNTKEKCAAVEQLPITGVIYDDTIKQAQFEGVLYVAPKPYVVDANEDPNLPDVKVLDGVCEDINGKCSLQAALDTAAVVSQTNSVLVNVTAGQYKLNRYLDLSVAVDTNPISLHGDEAGPTILDGLNQTDILRVTARKTNILIDNMTFENGIGGAIAGSRASGLGLQLTNGQFILNNCAFQKNSGLNVLDTGGSSNYEIHNCKFIDNNTGYATLYFFTANSVLIDRTAISRNNSIGISLIAPTGNVTIMNTLVADNQQGILSDSCANCLIENTTISNNANTGLEVRTFQPVFNPDFIVKNSTLFENGSLSGYNIAADFDSHVIASAANRIVFVNSVVATGNPAVTNCVVNAASGFTHAVVGFNSLFDDASCSQTGTGNFLAAPKLAALSYNGGPTWTRLPLSGSPLIDAGDNLSCSTLDQRGFIRPIDQLGLGPRCDIGAVELQ